MAIYSVYLTTLPTVGDGDPVNIAVDERGRLVIVGTMTGPLTDAELRATPVPIVQTPSSSIVCLVVGLTDSAVNLGAQACTSVLVQADPDNAVDVFVGSDSVQAIQLAPGASITIPVSNTNLVYAKTATGTANLNVLAMG